MKSKQGQARVRRVMPVFGLFIAAKDAPCGCMSNKAAKELGDSISAVFADALREVSGAQDLAYATAAFKRWNQRWPQDYAELDAFAQKTDGLLYLREYDCVEFTETPERDLKISYVFQGRTNFMAFSHREGEQR